MQTAQEGHADQPAGMELPSMKAVMRAAELMTSGFMTSDRSLFAADFVFHYFNNQRPELDGDYHGLDGMREFFGRLQAASRGSFHVEPISLTPFGDELVAVYATISLTLDGTGLEMDSLVVWRVVDGRIREAWDIPAVNTLRAKVPR